MRTLAMIAVFALAAFGQRHKLDEVDAGKPEGQLLQQCLQENDPIKKALLQQLPLRLARIDLVQLMPLPERSQRKHRDHRQRAHVVPRSAGILPQRFAPGILAPSFAISRRLGVSAVNLCPHRTIPAARSSFASSSPSNARTAAFSRPSTTATPNGYVRYPNTRASA